MCKGETPSFSPFRPRENCPKGLQNEKKWFIIKMYNYGYQNLMNMEITKYEAWYRRFAQRRQIHSVQRPDQCGGRIRKLPLLHH
jgi:hypothetical protein